MELQLLIIVAFAAGAGIFVVAASIGLLIHKTLEVRSSRYRKKLADRYVELCSEFLLKSSDDPDFASNPSVRLAFYKQSSRPLLTRLQRLPRTVQRVHRAVVKQVLLDLARDMSGEPVDRLNFLFYELGMVEEDVRRLKDRRWWVRAQAARDLGLARARGAMAPLAEALEDPREDVRYEAMRALAASIGVEALPTILASHDRLSQWDAVELSVIVMQFREKAVPFLLDALQASSTEVVLFCLEMLAEIGFVEAVEPVRELARSYPNVLVRAKAMEVLGRLGDGRAESLLMREINNPFPGLRLSAIRALAQIGTPAAVEPLLLRLKSADIEEQVVIMTALVRSGEKGRTTVHALEAGDDPKLRAVAAHVLETAMA